MKIEVYQVKGGYCVFLDFISRIEQYYFRNSYTANKFVSEIMLAQTRKGVL